MKHPNIFGCSDKSPPLTAVCGKLGLRKSHALGNLKRRTGGASAALFASKTDQVLWNPQIVETWEFELSPDLGRIKDSIVFITHSYRCWISGWCIVRIWHFRVHPSPHSLHKTHGWSPKKTSQSQNANENQPNQTQDSLYFYIFLIYLCNSTMAQYLGIA